MGVAGDCTGASRDDRRSSPVDRPSGPASQSGSLRRRRPLPLGPADTRTCTMAWADLALQSTNATGDDLEPAMSHTLCPTACLPEEARR